MNDSFLMIFTALALSVVVMSMMTIMIQYIGKRNERKYDDYNQRAILDLYRENFEKQIYELENRMANNFERWKDTNHLVLSTLKDDNMIDISSTNQLTRFLIASGIKQEDLTIDKKQVFVLTPYNKMFNDTYFAIKRICDSVGLKCSRGDEEYFPNDILTHILKQILKASIIIAIIDGRNPNVFYELGIAHALDKATILVTRTKNELPIDIKSKRIIFYKDKSDLKYSLRQEFIKIYTDIDNNDDGMSSKNGA
jgi:hypothetical protein